MFSKKFINRSSGGIVTNRSQGFVGNRRSGPITNRLSGISTNRGRGSYANVGNRRITDARQVLQRKNFGGLRTGNRGRGRFVTDLSQKLKSRTGVVGRLDQQRGGTAGRLYSARNNVGGNRLQNNRFQNNNALRNRPAFAKNYVDRSKFIKVHRGGITVTARQNNLQRSQRIGFGDELEETTLSDLPDPQSMSFSRAPSQSSLEDRLLQAAPREGNDSSATVLISNLKQSVTEEDIKELFGVVGEMSSAHLLHPGAALVTYARVEYALTALEQYNNVTLDGMAMRCTILSLDNQRTKPSISSRLGERTSSPLSASFLSPAGASAPQSSASFLRGSSGPGFRSTGRQVQPAWMQFAPTKRNPKFTVCLN